MAVLGRVRSNSTQLETAPSLDLRRAGGVDVKARIRPWREKAFCLTVVYTLEVSGLLCSTGSYCSVVLGFPLALTF